MSKVYIDNDAKVYIFDCPNCGFAIQVEFGQLNCREFVHGYYFTKINENIILRDQVNPHLDERSGLDLVSKGLIVGCGRPFRIVQNGEEFTCISTSTFSLSNLDNNSV